METRYNFVAKPLRISVILRTVYQNSLCKAKHISKVSKVMEVGWSGLPHWIRLSLPHEIFYQKNPILHNSVKGVGLSVLYILNNKIMVLRIVKLRRVLKAVKGLFLSVYNI